MGNLISPICINNLQKVLYYGGPTKRTFKRSSKREKAFKRLFLERGLSDLRPRVIYTERTLINSLCEEDITKRIIKRYSILLFLQTGSPCEEDLHQVARPRKDPYLVLNSKSTRASYSMRRGPSQGRQCEEVHQRSSKRRENLQNYILRSQGPLWRKGPSPGNQVKRGRLQGPLYGKYLLKVLHAKRDLK